MKNLSCIRCVVCVYGFVAATLSIKQKQPKLYTRHGFWIWYFRFPTHATTCCWPFPFKWAESMRDSRTFLGNWSHTLNRRGGGWCAPTTNDRNRNPKNGHSRERASGITEPNCSIGISIRLRAIEAARSGGTEGWNAAKSGFWSLCPRRVLCWWCIEYACGLCVFLEF